MIGDPYEVFFNDGSGFLNGLFYVGRLQWLKMLFEGRPCSIENLGKVCHKCVCILPFKVPEAVAGLFGNPFGNLFEFLWKLPGQVKMKPFLVVIGFEAIGLEKIPVIGVILCNFIAGRGESIHQQAPVFVRFTKIDRTIHGFHAPLFQPIPRCIK